MFQLKSNIYLNIFMYKNNFKIIIIYNIEILVNIL